MLSNNISLSGNEVLCEYVPMEQFKGFLQQRIGIAPDTLAVLIRDGQVADTSHGAHISVGGMWQSVKESIGGSHALQLLIADAKPFDATFPFRGLSKDNVVIDAEIALQLQVNPQSGSNILGLASQSSITNKSEIFERLIPHVNERALQAIVRQVDATTLRGAVDVQDKLQAEMLNVVEHLLGDMGIVVRATTVNWALNEEEMAQMASRTAEREQALQDEKLSHYNKEIERAESSTILTLNSNLALDKVKALSEDELRRLVAAQETQFVEVKEAATRAARLTALKGEIDEFKLEQEAKFKIAQDEAKNEVELKKVGVEIKELDLKIIDLQKSQEVALHKLEEMAKLELERAKMENDRLAREIQIAAIKKLNEAEMAVKKGEADITDDSADRESKRGLDHAQQADKTELEKLKLQQNMSADQLLAMQAGLSPEVAAVFAERAKTDQTSAAEQKELVQQIIDSGAKSSEDARYFFEQFKEGVIGVAAGAGPGNTASPATGAASAETVACPQCNKINAANRDFCVGCRANLRA